MEITEELKKQIRREAAQRSLVWFSPYVDRSYVLTPFHRTLAEILDRFAHGRIKKLIIQCAPQSGKSQLSSRFLPSYILGLNPDARVCIGSYSATLAQDFNRDVQRIIDSPEYRELFPETTLSGTNVVTMSDKYLRNMDVIEIVGHKGSLRVVGRGGALTGKTVDIQILDDVYKDYQEGSSPTIREAAWKWYTSVIKSRQHNNSQQLILFTRWHEDDIIGRIEQTEKVIKVNSWEDLENIPKGAHVLLNYPAIKVGDPTELDPRHEGEPLWPEMHSLEQLMEHKDLDPVQFECLYQGNPGNAEGRLYQPFKTYTEKTEWGTYIRSGNYTDVADEGDDYLASICYDVYRSDNEAYNEKTRRFEPILYALITDIEYTQESTEVTTVTVPAMINRNGTQKAWIESNNGGAGFEKVITKKVRCTTTPFYQGGNKESRIVSNAATVCGQIVFPFGWADRFPKAHAHLSGFLRNFSANKHDDLEDCLTGIVEKEIMPGSLLPYGHERRGVSVR